MSDKNKAVIAKELKEHCNNQVVCSECEFYDLDCEGIMRVCGFDCEGGVPATANVK